jgi:hypothetical protein
MRRDGQRNLVGKLDPSEEDYVAATRRTLLLARGIDPDAMQTDRWPFGPVARENTMTTCNGPACTGTGTRPLTILDTRTSTPLHFCGRKMRHRLGQGARREHSPQRAMTDPDKEPAQ